MKTRPLFPYVHPALAGLVAAFVLTSQALAITVTTVVDENDTPAGTRVSLREALRDTASGGQITFDAALNGKVVVLIAGEMTVAGKTLTVSAPGGLVIEARKKSRIFNVGAGAGLTLSGLTLQGGKGPGDGGAILNAGTLNLTDCVLRNNRVTDGVAGGVGASGGSYGGIGGTGGTGSSGGAVSSSGSLSAVRCSFVENAAGTGGNGGQGGSGSVFGDGGTGGTGGTGGSGGGILSAGPLQLTDCIFEGNSAGTGGGGGEIGWPGGNVRGSSGGDSGNGGALHQTGDATVERCTFAGNRCPSGGQPIVNYPFWVQQSVGGSSGSGAGLFWASGTGTLTNCTLNYNSMGYSGGFSRGGTITAEAGTLLKLVHCTVAGNVAQEDSFHYPSDKGWARPPSSGIISAGSVLCHNCIISGNTVGAAEINLGPNTQPTVIPFGPLGGAPGVDAKLGLLALTSGALPVLVPGAGSPALNAGAIISSPPATDQRGLPRPVGAPDLGAVEVQPVETAARKPQSIWFSPPVSALTSSIQLNASASSTLPVSLELVSGPATLNGDTLTFTGPGFAAVRASQTGDATWAPALPIVGLIEAPHAIQFTPEASYTVYPPAPRMVTLPATTSAGLPVAWTLVGPLSEHVSLSGNLVTATGADSVQVRGQNPGDSLYGPVDTTLTLTFVAGSVSWDTPPAPGGGPHWYTLVEGSPYGLTMTARIAAPHPVPVAVPGLPAGVIATPAAIPAGQTSVQSVLTLNANPQLTNQVQEMATAAVAIKLILANRANVPLDIFAPATVAAGAVAQVDVSAPGVPTPQLFAPPPNLALRSVTVSAVDFDNPSISVPVTLGEVSTDNGLYPRKHLPITFPSENRRLRLTVTTDDGISGTAGPIQITGGTIADRNLDGDGVNDIVEAALQRAPDQFHQSPLSMVRDANGLHAVLGNRPLDLQGWTVVIEISSNLQTWTPAPAAAITQTPNPDNTTERVSVLLTPGSVPSFARLRVQKP